MRRTGIALGFCMAVAMGATVLAAPMDSQPPVVPQNPAQPYTIQSAPPNPAQSPIDSNKDLIDETPLPGISHDAQSLITSGNDSDVTRLSAEPAESEPVRKQFAVKPVETPEPHFLGLISAASLLLLRRQRRAVEGRS